jgi:hypothetical protein
MSSMPDAGLAVAEAAADAPGADSNGEGVLATFVQPATTRKATVARIRARKKCFLG